jgi:hypothetical protein
VVVNTETGEIAAFDEQRKAGSSSVDALLTIDDINYGDEYGFLILLGYWPRNFSSENPSGNTVTYVYDDSALVKPVLLAAGYTSQVVTGNGTVMIDVWPLIIDTSLVQGNVTIQPSIGEASYIYQGAMPSQVIWKIGKKADGSENGLEALIKSSVPADTGANGPLPVSAKKHYVDLTSSDYTTPTSTTNVFNHALPVKNAMADIGTTYGVNFEIEYVPFNKTTGADWTNYNSKSKFTLGANPPVWIIRNGLYNEKQTGATNFSLFGKPNVTYDYKYFNANGGILVEVKETKGYTDVSPVDEIPDGSNDTDDDGYPENPGTNTGYVLYNGSYMGNNKVKFSTSGYTGLAEVYYYITEPNLYNKTSRPPYNLFTTKFTSNYGPGQNHEGTVNSPINGSADIWLVFIKDGQVSNRIAVKTGGGGLTVGWQWGDGGTSTPTPTKETLVNEILSSLVMPEEGYRLTGSDFYSLIYTNFTDVNGRAWIKGSGGYNPESPGYNIFPGDVIFLSYLYVVEFELDLKSGTLPVDIAGTYDHDGDPTACVIIERVDDIRLNVRFIFGEYGI